MPVAEVSGLETAKALYLQGLPVPQIALTTCINLNTLRGHILRKGWSRLKDATRSGIAEIVVNQAQTDRRRVGERTRDKFAQVAETFANSLAERKLPRSLEGQNLMADTLAKTAKTAALVHGWENTTINAIVMAGDTTDAIESLCAEPIDVESVPTEQA